MGLFPGAGACCSSKPNWSKVFCGADEDDVFVLSFEDDPNNWSLGITDVNADDVCCTGLIKATVCDGDDYTVPAPTNLSGNPKIWIAVNQITSAAKLT